MNGMLIKTGRTVVQTAANTNIDHGLGLQGESESDVLSIPDDLLGYVRSLLRDDPLEPPKVSQREWFDFLPMLASHGILPLLYWRISALPSQSHPPGDVVARLRHASLASLVDSVRMERQLREVIDGFRKDGVRVLVLKGPALAWSIYPTPALRPSVDLDLLAPPEQMNQSRAILERLGYRCKGKMFDTYQDIFCDEQFIHQEKPQDNRPIELHWHVHPYFGSSRCESIEELFCRAVEIMKPSLTFESLHPVDALIHAAIHLTMHHNRQMRLVWIYDIALLARSLVVPDDWEALQERSIEWRARLAAENSLKLAQNWAGLQLPEGFNDFLAWPRPTHPELDAWTNATNRHERKKVLLRLHMPGSSGIFDQVRSLLRLIFPPPDRIRQTYPPPHDWLLPLSYARRWLRWLGR